MKKIINRRRFIKIAAANSVGLLLSGSLLESKIFTGQKPTIWNGIVLGANASMTLFHEDNSVAKKVLANCHKEILRLENIFTLYDSLSSLSQLNFNGSIINPPIELINLLSKAKEFGELTEGAFDVTIHPLSDLYADHFKMPNPDPSGPTTELINLALNKVDYRAIEILNDRIKLKKPGMRITLNGIAQGYITDRITGILKDAGLTHVLVELGEKRAIGNHPEGRPWQIGLQSPDGTNKLLETVQLQDRAMATSGGYGTIYDKEGKHHHLINPRNGKSVHHYSTVTVLAPDATMADALSTGLSVMSPKKSYAILNRLTDVSAIFVDQDGSIRKA